MNHTKINFLLILLTLLLITQNVFAQEFNRNIIGYFTSWSVYARDYHVPDIPADKINHINYAFANIDHQAGTIMLGDPYADIDKWYPGDSWDPDSLRGSFHQLQILKAENPHVKTLISVGGWTWSTYFSDIALTEESRQTFAASCVDFIQEYEFDGVDIDWEYPVEGGHPGNIYRPEDKENFTLLLEELRIQLDDAGDYLLTVATTASPFYMENIEIDSIHQYVDWINIMTYDFHGPWGGEDADPVTNFNAALYMASDDPLEEPYHSSFNLDAAVQAYLAEGVPPEKINPGLAFYGRGYGGVTDENNGLYQPYWGVANAGTWENGVFDYWDLAENYINLNGYTAYWHNDAKVPWLYNPDTQIMISYDDAASIEEKGNYINDTNLGGAMFWEFSGDKYAVLTDAIYETLHDTTSTSVEKNNFVDFSSAATLHNYPNPFNPTTTIKVVLPQSGYVTVEIYDSAGKLVKNLAAKNVDAGYHEFVWDGTDNRGKAVGSGRYVSRISTENYSRTNPMILLK